MATTSTSGAVYWIGSDNNIYLKGAPGVSGVKNLGQAPSSMGIDNNANNGYGITSNQINLPGANYQAQLIDDPDPNGKAPAATLSSTSSGSDQADTAAYWNDQENALQQQITNLDPQQQTGAANIQGSYNSALQTLLNGDQQNTATYNANKASDVTSNETAKNQINQNVQQNNTAIQRLLGSRGAGSSSAASIAAPLAVATQGNSQRTAQNTSFGTNEQALDLAMQKEKGDLANSEGDLANQQTDKLNTLNQGIATSKLSLVQQLANAKLEAGQAAGQTYVQARAAETPYQSQISQLLGQIDSLGAQPTFTPQAVNYTPPSLASYVSTPTAAPVVSGGTAGGVDTSGAGAFASLLNGAADKQKLTGASLTS